MSRATMNDVSHAAAERVAPLVAPAATRFRGLAWTTCAHEALAAELERPGTFHQPRECPRLALGATAPE